MVQHFVRVPFISAECHTSVPSAVRQCRVDDQQYVFRRFVTGPGGDGPRQWTWLLPFHGWTWLYVEVKYKNNKQKAEGKLMWSGRLAWKHRTRTDITSAGLLRQTGFLGLVTTILFLLQIWALQGASLVHSLLAEIPALFVTLLIESTEHKMAALMVVFSLRSTVDFLTKRTRNGVTNVFV